MELVLLHFFVGLSIVFNTIGLVAGIGMLATRHKNRGWEHPLAFIFRCLISLAVLALVLKSYRDDAIGPFWTVVLLGLAEVPQAAYLLINDRKHTLASGKEWRFL